MQKISNPWLIAVVLSVISLIILFLPSNQPKWVPPPLDDSIELASRGQAEVVSVRAEVIEEGAHGPEMVVYSTTSGESTETASQPVTMELPDGQTVTLQGSDLALGKRFSISDESADPFRRPGVPEASGPSAKVFQAMAIDMRGNAELPQRIVVRDMDLEEAPDLVEPTPPSTPESLVLTLTPGAYQLAELGGWEVPVFVVARRRLENSDELAATTVPEAISILVEASATEPRTVTIEEGRTRSTGGVVVPLRRTQDVEVTATDLSGNASSARLTVSWSAHGPKSLELKIFPQEADGYATRLSPVNLHAHVELDELPLRPGRALALRTSGPKEVTVEPAEVTLGPDGDPVTLTVLGHGDVAETLKIQIPDLHLESEVTVRFRRPYLFLGLAALLGVLGVVVARRRPLFEQGKRAIALELLAAATGGVLLYAAFLMQWLPTPGFVVGALPAAAVGVLGGYAGEGVFQILLKVTGLAR